MAFGMSWGSFWQLHEQPLSSLMSSSSRLGAAAASRVVDAQNGMSDNDTMGGRGMGGLVTAQANAQQLTSKQQATLSMYEAMEQGDPATVTNTIMVKVFNNLRYWAASEDVLQETIDLFLDIASSGSSGR